MECHLGHVLQEGPGRNHPGPLVFGRVGGVGQVLSLASADTHTKSYPQGWEIQAQAQYCV